MVHEEVTEGPDLVKNTNAADVHAAARERREHARLEAQRKKEKDKEDRYNNYSLLVISTLNWLVLVCIS